MPLLGCGAREISCQLHHKAPACIGGLAAKAPDVLVGPSLQLGQEAGICCAQMQTHRSQRQAVVLLAGLPYCGCVHIGQDLFCPLQEQAVKGWLVLPAMQSHKLSTQLIGEHPK